MKYKLINIITEYLTLYGIVGACFYLFLFSFDIYRDLPKRLERFGLLLTLGLFTLIFILYGFV